MSARLGFPENVCISLSLLFKVTAEVGKLLGEEKVDAILCVAGGWAGGNAKSKCESSFELVIRLSCSLSGALGLLGSVLRVRSDVFRYGSQDLYSSSAM